ncbi:hypothetical protein PRIPAC_81332, partial [Pristionchus pacificus]|uniref:Acyl-coenzyme A oxidase n=1 Tax=Pristionchus pacificus TaxID=54126 RepID=A0A2A6CM76_PRIPA
AGDNPDLTKARQSANFHPEDVTAFLFGSKEIVERKREISRKASKFQLIQIAADTDLANSVPLEFLSREKLIEEQCRKASLMVKKVHELVDVSNQAEMKQLNEEVFCIEGFPFFLHFGMFLPVLQGQAHEELAAEFLPRAMTLGIIGTYAQTEMGHGTNLRELETTATYDKRAEEFVLHSPTRSAMKWWPGNLGKMSNYAIVTAQLIIDGKRYGPHNFLVQLRSEKDHRPLPGITVGDIGPKFGAGGLDNGFLGLDRVRIPRTRMLMKHAKVARDGTYTPPIHSKLNYGGMVYVRAHMSHTQANGLALAVTVATRYSAIRRQGRIAAEQVSYPELNAYCSQPEVQVLDYQTQQYRLFPQIARAYAYRFVGDEVLELYQQTMKGIDNGEAALGIEQCRMACGGHGYSLASGLPKPYAIVIAGCTYEGENMVMLQQAARYLMKSVKRAARGEKLSYSVQYLGKTGAARSSIGRCEGQREKEYEAMLSSLEHVARRLAQEACVLWNKRIEAGETKERAWNGVTVEMNRAARIYTRLFIARAFHRRVTSAPASVRPVLIDLLSLYLHYECVDMASHLLHDGHCTGEQIKHIKQKLYEDLAKIRPNAVSLVDAFDISDRQLNSVLGKRDGNVYEALYQWAKASELNYTDVLPAFGHLQQMMEENRAKI